MLLTTITILPHLSCTPDVDLLGVVDGIPEEDADRPTSPPSAVSGLLLDTAVRSGQIPELRLQPWQTANKLGIG